jgi:predicted nucleic acid-binding protein
VSHPAYLFDTNAFTLLLEGDVPTTQRLAAVQEEAVWLSSVAVEEILAGRLALIQRARGGGRSGIPVPDAHESLAKALTDLQALPVLTYSDAAERVFAGMPASVKRVGSQDGRIAAQAMAHGMTVVTRNLRDLRAIGAPREDWSVAGSGG